MQAFEKVKALSRLASRESLYRQIVTPDVEDQISRMPKPVGSYGYDAWGYNENAAKLGLGVVKLLYEKYFRVVAHGIENIPTQGRALFIANHSGQLPMDGVLIGGAMALNPHGPRAPRAMVDRFFPTVPWLGSVMTGIGAVIGDPLNCVKMLEQDEAIIVFPEGVRGSGKLYRKRYQLQRFGNGFMHLAMQTGAPIVPVGVVGCEETMPSFANIAPLAKLLGLPYVPFGPLLPLPARVYLNFGEPICFDNTATSEEAVTERVELIKDKIRELMARGLAERKSVF
ncbi:lysophospholipid acyltransferase family protein [Solimonas marina]|uniref:Acyltransferase family protein n=1 Tax=Solimonas marina TaxID=2714601 RepID=A0A969WB08_9GAMM|nr:lysophospholipid acyltransferase family protein [Solimonas marina]NKF22186.1 acyltransferase family protein [Solimonas marina]